MSKYTLFATDNHFSELLAGETTVSLAAISPRIDDVIDEFIIPITGPDLLNAICTEVISEQEMSEEIKKVHRLVAKAAAHLSLAISADDLNVKSAVGGFVVTTGESVNIASSERVRRWAEQRAIDGQNALNKLISFLEKNADTYPLYAESDHRAGSFKNFVNSSDEMNEFIVPGVGWLVFKRMLPQITLVEDTIIRETLCQPLYDHLKSVIKNRDGLTDGVPDFGPYVPLIPLIQRAVCNLALSQSMTRLGLKLDYNYGIYQSFYKNANEPAQSELVKGADLRSAEQVYLKDGQRAMEILKKELQDNVEDYPLYGNSPCYSAPEENYTKNDDPTRGSAVFFGPNG